MGAFFVYKKNLMVSASCDKMSPSARLILYP